jgi:hypothetical protein
MKSATSADTAMDQMDQNTHDIVLNCADLPVNTLETLLSRYGLRVVWLPPESSIPGSYWGDREAGLQGNRLYIRPDTPVHSALHEGCHFICMDDPRRAGLDTDAGGDDLEEAAVCYLQILLADQLPGVGRERLLADMDRWGYSFRLGSSRTWFNEDAADARAWLHRHGLIDQRDRPTFERRD